MLRFCEFGDPVLKSTSLQTDLELKDHVLSC